ncbi:hypothetical protein [Cyanothece sp. BG0011]|uniref:hypothetical protein n=1 Tax=Cyanothece sp. BG0011 TaxID=2082950 RepID=UPI000D1FC0FC|nr:hypothetical protein [Cyanothece sp. BG0011]
MPNPQKQTLKPILKELLYELLTQEQDLLKDLIYEVIEDMAMANAIKEGIDSENVSREEIFSLLED